MRACKSATLDMLSARIDQTLAESRYIWEYVCVEERVSEAPPAVVRRICGYVGLYVWWRERESEREGEGRGRGGGGRNNNNPSSKPLDKHNTSFLVGKF